MGSSARRRVARPFGILVALIATVLLTGCLDVSFHTRLEADGTGTLRVEVILGEELVEAFGSFGGPITSEDLIEETSTDLPPGFDDRARFSPLTDEVGVSAEIDFENIEELNLLLSDTGVDGAGDDGVVERLEFDADGDRVRFSAIVGGTDAFATDDEFAMFFGDLAVPEISFSVELPGTIGDTNADEVDGRTATWDLVAAAGTTIFAESGTSTSLLDSVWLLIAVGIVGLLAVVLLVVVLVRLRRSSSAPAGGPSGGIPTGVGSAAGAPFGGGPSSGGPSAPPGWGDTAGTPPVPPAMPPATPAMPPATPAMPPAPPQPMSTPPEAPTAPREPVSAAPTPAAGWYPDPGGSGRHRWWNGTTWTDHLQ